MLKHSLIALAALGAGIIGFSPSGAQAFTVQQQPAAQTDTGSNLMVEVKRHRDNRRTRYWNHWDRRYHGNRCRNWSSNCRHYRNGWYYANPWWVLPFVGAGIALGAQGGYDGYSSRHVRWCSDRYRSYNPRTNTWVAYSGRVYQCNSPYN